MKILIIITLLIFQSITENIIDPDQQQKHTIYTYGLHSPDDNARFIVAERWNLEFVSVADCMISPDMVPLIDSIKVLNKKTEAILSLKYGESWKKDFEVEVAEEYLELIAIENTMDCQPFIAQLKNTIVIPDPLDETDRFFDEEPTPSKVHPFYYFKASKESGTYLVHVYGHGNWKERVKTLHFYKLKYSISDQKFTILDQETKLLNIDEMVAGE